MLADLADIDDDNDDIDEFSDGDDEDEDDDLDSSESDCDLRKSMDEAKVKDGDKKVQLQVTGSKRKKEANEVKRGPEDKVSESDTEIESSVGAVKKQKVDGVKIGRAHV